VGGCLCYHDDVDLRACFQCTVAVELRSDDSKSTWIFGGSTTVVFHIHYGVFLLVARSPHSGVDETASSAAVLDLVASVTSANCDVTAVDQKPRFLGWMEVAYLHLGSTSWVLRVGLASMKRGVAPSAP